jgi:enolase-phosphatase E1
VTDSPRAVVLDVEGTTTPVAFVHEVLFPFAAERVESFLDEHREAADVHAELHALWREYAADPDAPRDWAGGVEDRAGAARYVRWLIEHDRKATPLKALQGRMWEQGYRSGELVSHVYPDVPGALERWRAAGATIAIFSSGSVLAQQLIFEHSDAGNLRALVDAHFDTNVGAKREAGSYRRIVEELGVAAGDALFVSDVVEELDAARAAGLATALCVRDGDGPAPGGHPVVTGFDALAPQPSSSTRSATDPTMREAR